MRRRGYIGPYGMLPDLELSKEQDLVHEEYEQNYELLKDAADRGDWGKHQEYVKRERELNVKDERLISEAKLRRKYARLRRLQKEGRLQEAQRQ